MIVCDCTCCGFWPHGQISRVTVTLTCTYLLTSVQGHNLNDFMALLWYTTVGLQSWWCYILSEYDNMSCNMSCYWSWSTPSPLHSSHATTMSWYTNILLQLSTPANWSVEHDIQQSYLQWVLKATDTCYIQYRNSMSTLNLSYFDVLL